MVSNDHASASDAAPAQRLDGQKTVVVVGTGYVGLPAAVMLAHAGYRVVGIDINENIVRAINEGVLHIDEADLQGLMQDPVVQQNLRARNRPCEGDIFIIAVPTPLDERKKVADMSYVISAVESIVPVLGNGNLIIIESTIPPLTCREIVTPLLEESGLSVGEEIFLAHCPERILPGNIFYEIVHNDRIIGSASEEGRRLAKEMYQSFVVGNLYETDDVTAELCKLVENTYRDVNIALANEVNAVAERLGADGKEVIALANKHPRVNLLQPGIGVGGHCIPIDPWFIKEVDPANSRLIFTARLVNDEMPMRTAAKIRASVAGIPSPRVLILGATYKPDTYDLRESPALEVVEILKGDGYCVEVYDPLTKEYPMHKPLSQLAVGADCLVILVPHQHMIRELASSYEQIRSVMRTPIILRF